MVLGIDCRGKQRSPNPAITRNLGATAPPGMTRRATLAKHKGDAGFAQDDAP